MILNLLQVLMNMLQKNQTSSDTVSGTLEKS
jgi:hypothetical protein